jgi:hypothetical protein
MKFIQQDKPIYFIKAKLKGDTKWKNITKI